MENRVPKDDVVVAVEDDFARALDRFPTVTFDFTHLIVVDPPWPVIDITFAWR